jgi:hypothetical protein
MRHYFIRHAIEQQIDYRVIADWVGHTDGGAHIGRTYGGYNLQNPLEMASRMKFAVPFPEVKRPPKIRYK